MLCLGQSLIPLIWVSLFHLATSGCCHLQRRLYSLAGLSCRPSVGGLFEGCFALKGSGLPKAEGWPQAEPTLGPRAEGP
jgi:hypothetical protein